MARFLFSSTSHTVPATRMARPQTNAVSISFRVLTGATVAILNFLPSSTPIGVVPYIDEQARDLGGPRGFGVSRLREHSVGNPETSRTAGPKLDNSSAGNFVKHVSVKYVNDDHRAITGNHRNYEYDGQHHDAHDIGPEARHRAREFQRAKPTRRHGRRGQLFGPTIGILVLGAALKHV